MNSVASDNGAAGRYLGQLTWPEATTALQDLPIVLLPFAAGAKEHGPHLAMNADQVVMEYLLDAVVESMEVLVAPPILHGWFPAFRDFPGTEVADPGVFQNYVREVAESLIRHGAQRLVLLNMGVARATGLPLGVVARDLHVDHGLPVLLISWDDLETDEVAEFSEQRRGGHADEIETSLNLYLQPERVYMERAVADYRGDPARQIGYAPGKFTAEESGVFGDPTLATAEKGERVLAIMRSNLLEALEQFAER
ncbi:MAG: creatininase family protein [Gammaproteobacteria bacterium]|nr:MAG: creatininase family protein [Chloroflexota bacterium]TDJ42462.1 MAG: creatininase family protein [Gammaproteobacteria bacterium]